MHFMIILTLVWNNLTLEEKMVSCLPNDHINSSKGLPPACQIYLDTLLGSHYKALKG